MTMKKRRIERSAKQDAKQLAAEAVQLTPIERTALQTVLRAITEARKLNDEVMVDLLRARGLPEDTQLDLLDLDRGLVRFRAALPPDAVTPPAGAADKSIAEKVVQFRKAQAAAAEPTEENTEEE